MAQAEKEQWHHKRYPDPLLDDGVRGWIVRHAKRHHWRVASNYELADLIQDGYMCFANTRKAYPHINDPKHVMGLFKRIYSNHITDLANARTAGDDIPLSQIASTETTEERLLETLLDSENELGSIFAAIKSAPKELVDLMELFMSDVGQVQINRPPRWDRQLMRETNNQRLCRLIGCDPTKVNLTAMFKSHFMGIGPDEPTLPSWEGFLLATAKAAHELLAADTGMPQQA